MIPRLKTSRIYQLSELSLPVKDLPQPDQPLLKISRDAGIKLVFPVLSLEIAAYLLSEFTPSAVF
jgi:hypothetical protein